MTAATAAVELDVRPLGPYRLPSAGRDGILRRRTGALVRVLHRDGEQAVARAWTVSGAVRIRGEARTRETAAWAVERMRFALGVDHDLRGFQRAFNKDPLLGPVIRRKPWIRPIRRPEPFEALAWAITEQLIDSDRAARRAGGDLPAERALRVWRPAAAAVQGPCPGSSALVNAPAAPPRIRPPERKKSANARHCAGSW